MSSISKQIWSYINENNDDSIFEKALNKTIKTKMIAPTKIPNEFIFNSKYGKAHKFEVVKEEILLNERLVSNLTKLILKQLELSAEIPTYSGSEKGNYTERSGIKIESIVCSLVFYKWEENKDKISVLDMAADILYRIATLNHPFTNGNKRTALLSCGAFLYSVGLYLFFYKMTSKANYLKKFLLINFENKVILYDREMLIS